jgi:ferredoxin
MPRSKSGVPLVHLRRKCIGCGACALAAPDLWSLSDVDGLADVQGGHYTGGQAQIRVPIEDVEDHRAAAEACPVGIIHLS